MRSIEHHRYPLRDIQILFQANSLRLGIIVDQLAVLIENVENEIGQEKHQRAFARGRRFLDG